MLFLILLVVAGVCILCLVIGMSTKKPPEYTDPSVTNTSTDDPSEYVDSSIADTSTESLSEYIDTFGYGTIEKGAMEKICLFAEQCNDKASLKKQYYSFDRFTRGLGITRKGAVETNTSFMMAAQNINTVNQAFPIMMMEKIDDSLVYTTYTIQEKNDMFELYVFFENTSDSDAEEQWMLSRQAFFMNKTLSYSDFADICVGSTIEQVVAIDPVAEFQFNKNVSENVRNWKKFETRHLLVDGDLTLSYSRETREDVSPKVVEISLNKDFALQGRKGIVYNFRINPEDYVNY